MPDIHSCYLSLVDSLKEFPQPPPPVLFFPRGIFSLKNCDPHEFSYFHFPGAFHNCHMLHMGSHALENKLAHASYFV